VSMLAFVVYAYIARRTRSLVPDPLPVARSGTRVRTFWGLLREDETEPVSLPAFLRFRGSEPTVVDVLMIGYIALYHL